MNTMSQLNFTWRLPPSFAPEDFISSSASAEALELLAAWPKKDAHIAFISGPEACGKTHLAVGWAAKNAGIFIDTRLLGNAESICLWRDARYAVLEDVHAISDETALFHLIRDTELHDRRLLLTSRTAAPLLNFTLPDLRSRLRALPSATISAPDEALLRAFILKCFADRQRRIGKEAADYLALHIERTFASACAWVEKLDEYASSQKREITVPLIKALLV